MIQGKMSRWSDEWVDGRKEGTDINLKTLAANQHQVSACHNKDSVVLMMRSLIRPHRHGN